MRIVTALLWIVIIVGVAWDVGSHGMLSEGRKTSDIMSDMKQDRGSSEYICGRTLSRADQDQATYGYATEIALAQAVESFNKELKCVPRFAKFPPLTEDEVIAAIVAGPDYGSLGGQWLAQREALGKIGLQKVLPKGTLLVLEGGGGVNLDSDLWRHSAKGLRIYLFLDLNKNPRESDILKPEQIFLIRKSYFGIEV